MLSLLSLSLTMIPTFTSILPLSLTLLPHSLTFDAIHLQERPDLASRVVGLQHLHRIVERRRALDAVKHRGVRKSPAPVELLGVQVLRHCSVASLGGDGSRRPATVVGSVGVRPASTRSFTMGRWPLQLAHQSAVHPLVVIAFNATPCERR